MRVTELFRSGRSRLIVAIGVLAVAAPAAAHELDHPAPSFTRTGPPSLRAIQGGENAKWEFVASFPTGNPHTDLDFFTQGGETFASVGTLGTGPNGGGQSIFQLTQGGKVDPKYVSSQPSASCLSNPAAALGLQHDVEATPKGGAILNTDVIAADRRDTQLLLDASDAAGRCHDQGVLGLENAPPGGLEIIDVTKIAAPVAIGLTSHVGEAHTVNVDPKRPHIAFVSSSDSVSVDATGKRGNDGPDGTQTRRLDGFEVVDLSSCMNFPAGTSLERKRELCRPAVFRYRWPTVAMARGHTNRTGANGVFACHELEIYPDDRLACGGGNAAILLDLAGAFDDAGTPNDYSDDKPRGTPLPCAVRDSSSQGPFKTGAKVTDCVIGDGGQDLGVPEWQKIGSPSLMGVEHIGSAFHQGREATADGARPDFGSDEDIDFDHEAELTHTGKFILATDERGGGVAPPGASCSPGVDIKQGNGGVHAYRVDRLLKESPADAKAAHASYALGPDGKKAIFRVPVRTGPQDSLCTAHVFHQIPGQNRIFMAWYSQGTHVLDYTERADGTFVFNEAGWWIPEHANQWVSAIFRVDRNSDGTFTYWGATGDFALGSAGRSAVDVFKVTLPPPGAPKASDLPPGVGPGFRPVCVASRKPRRARVRKGRLQVRTTLRSQGGPVRRAVVRLRGAGIRKAKRTNSKGQANFKVRAKRKGRLVVHTRSCHGRMKVRIKRLRSSRR